MRRGRTLRKIRFETGRKLPGLHVPVKVERYYDRRARTWVVRYLDSMNNQCGESYFTGVKSDAMFCELDFQKQLKNGTAGRGYNA